MTRSNNIFLGRNDTMLGICESVGQDFGFNPNWLRVGLGLALLFNPIGVVLGYLALGVVVFVSRLIWPSRSIGKPVPAAARKVTKVEAVNDTQERELALAA